jgi:hypothetical protein
MTVHQHKLISTLPEPHIHNLSIPNQLQKSDCNSSSISAVIFKKKEQIEKNHLSSTSGKEFLCCIDFTGLHILI